MSSDTEVLMPLKDLLFFIFDNSSHDKPYCRCLPVICSIHSLLVKKHEAQSVSLSLISALSLSLSLSLFVSLSFVSSTETHGFFSFHREPQSNPQTAREEKGITSVYLHISMFKKQGEKKTQRSTDVTRLLRGCRIRKSKLPLEDERGSTPFLSDPPAWSHLTCTFGLKSRVMSQLPCASQRWPAFPALPPSSFYWPSCYCGSSSLGRSWWEPPPPAPPCAPAPTRPAESSAPGRTWRRCPRAYQSTRVTSTCRRTRYR